MSSVFANSKAKSERKGDLEESKKEAKVTKSLPELKKPTVKRNLLMTCFGSSCGAVVCDRSSRSYSRSEAVRMLEWIEDACANGEFS